MKEIPILMSAPMVRALLDGSKTQTRRVVKPQPVRIGDGTILQWRDGLFQPERMPTNSNLLTHCPYGQPGNRLWVRETFCDLGEGSFGLHEIEYRADGECDPNVVPRWTPSIHMPRWASRILLEITSVRVERLQDISEPDADAEGCERLESERYDRDPALCPKCDGLRLHRALGPNGGVIEDVDCVECNTYVKRYRHLWESINGAGSWDANPWVWVIEFKRVTP